ncbi:MAG: rhomboid family intramembrane serine protease [Gemmatimonadetes bacterium]|nr:rhomboid family intramembrane serine protease [Gemmatimonadota bacterium]
MFPYRDDNPTLRTPFVTAGIIAVTTVIWVVVQGAGSQPALARSVCELGAIPGELLGRLPEIMRIPLTENLACEVGVRATWYTVITSIFMHGSWFHLIGNMWFLWIFGNNVEDSMGHVRFAAFYLICGTIAAFAQIFASPSSPIPMVGASGAISGIMGAYLVLYPRVRVHMLVFLGFWVTTVAVPAYLMLFYWAFLQLIGSLPALGDVAQEKGGIAFLAHLGGFVAGAVLIKLFAKSELVDAHRRAIAAQVFNEPWRSGSGWE